MKCRSFMVNEKNENILHKCSEVKNEKKELIVKDFDVEVIQWNKYIATILKSFNNEIKTDFHDEGLPPEQTPCLTCFLILIDLAYKVDVSCYSQIPSEKC